MGIKRLEASSPDAVFAFLDRQVGRRDRAHWTWKYQLAGDAGERAFFHTGADGTVNGFIGVLPTRLCLPSGGDVRAAWFVDWASGTGGVGAGVGLLRRAQATTDVLLTLQGSADTRAILPKLRWSEVGRPGLWVLPLTTAALAARGVFRRYAVLRPAAALARLWFRARPPGEDRYALREVARFPDSYDDVWARRRAEFAPCMERSSAQLNFLLTEFPEQGYRRFLVLAGGEVLGHLVLRIDRTPDHTRGRIIDALWDRTRPDMARWLVRQAAWMLQQQGVDTIECTASAADLEAALRASRFSRRRAVPIWWARLPDGVPSPDAWYVTFFDCDRAWR